MDSWMIYTIIYGIISGTYYLFQKEAMKKDHSIEVLTTFITISFILLLFETPSAVTIEPGYLLLIFLKSFIIFISWVLSFKAMSKISISLYGVINMSRILFTTLLGIIFLHECITGNELVGMIFIMIGLVLVNTIDSGEKSKKEKKYVTVLLIACVLCAISGLLDKVVSTNVPANQYQWWMMLFLFIISWIYIFIRKININFKSTFKNYWIYLYSILFIVGDRILFLANGVKGSEISIISLLKQVSVIITVLVGGKIFKEKGLGKKFVCSLIILLGIIIITLY